MKHILSIVAALAAIPAFAQAANTATLTWVAPTTYVDGTPVTAVLTYNIYQGVQGAAKTKSPTPVSGLTTTISTGLLSKTTYCWQVSASDGAVEGALSNEACKTFPASAPTAPSLTVK